MSIDTSSNLTDVEKAVIRGFKNHFGDYDYKEVVEKLVYTCRIDDYQLKKYCRELYFKCVPPKDFENLFYRLVCIEHESNDIIKSAVIFNRTPRSEGTLWARELSQLKVQELDGTILLDLDLTDDQFNYFKEKLEKVYIND